MSGGARGVVAVGRRPWTLLLVLAATTFFEGYDRSVVVVALPLIREDFGLSQPQAAWLVAAIYAGSVPAVALARLADRVGRRRVLLVTVVGYTAATAGTAASSSAVEFAAWQLAARLFLCTEIALAGALVAEELPAETRGFGFGWLAMWSALGVGAAAAIRGLVLAPNDWSWRVLYVVALPALAAVIVVRRALPESARFERARAEAGLVGRWSVILGRSHRGRLTRLLAIALLAELPAQAGIFAVDFLETSRGVSAAAASASLVVAGAPLMPLLVLAGMVSDRVGRRAVATAAALAGVAGIFLFFFVDGGLPLAVGALSLLLAGQLLVWPMISTLTAELFPTGLRAQAASWSVAARAIGSLGSLGIGAAVLTATDSLPVAAAALAVGPLAAVALLSGAPPTHGVELEDAAAPAQPGGRW